MVTEPVDITLLLIGRGCFPEKSVLGERLFFMANILSENFTY